MFKRLLLGGIALLVLSHTAMAQTQIMDEIPGYDDASVQAGFAPTIEAHFSTWLQTTAIMRRLTPYEILRVRQLYYTATNGNTAVLDNLVAQTMPIGFKKKWDSVSPEAVTANLAWSVGSRQHVIPRIKAGPAPTISMTPEMIYLEFRTATVGSLDVGAALWETAQFMGTRLSGAWAAGYYVIGTPISWLIQNYAPNLDDAIGGTVSNMIDQIVAAGDQADQGQFNAALRALFGLPPDGDIPLKVSFKSRDFLGLWAGQIHPESDWIEIGTGGSGGYITVSEGFFDDGGGGGGEYGKR
jgi:hypothetical protein